ncbi:MAG TPA: carboxypeptidase regulatory-like domain-containing protein [Candidatus Binatia bacterium]|nr:carboxypeptidase regulatory-like domain-containing protein [Candidatus Binatia bacterium]
MKKRAFRLYHIGRAAKPYLPIALGIAGCFIAGVSRAETIKGNIRYVGAPIEKKKNSVTIDQYVCGKEKEPEDLLLSSNNGIRNAIVSLQNVPTGVKRDWDFPAAKMDQKQCSFTPRVVIVPVGGTVEFLNSDRLLHNVRSTAKENPPFNRAQPHARSISFVFKQPELLRVDCDLHSWMRGWVMVADHPFYAVTNEQGEFVLENVPPGKYTLQVWQESLGRQTQEVVVTDKATTTVSVAMGKK